MFLAACPSFFGDLMNKFWTLVTGSLLSIIIAPSCIYSGINSSGRKIKGKCCINFPASFLASILNALLWKENVKDVFDKVIAPMICVMQGHMHAYKGDNERFSKQAFWNIFRQSSYILRKSFAIASNEQKMFACLVCLALPSNIAMMQVIQCCCRRN